MARPPAWRLPDAEVAALVEARHGAPLVPGEVIQVPK